MSELGMLAILNFLNLFFPVSAASPIGLATFTEIFASRLFHGFWCGNPPQSLCSRISCLASV